MVLYTMYSDVFASPKCTSNWTLCHRNQDLVRARRSGFGRKVTTSCTKTAKSPVVLITAKNSKKDEVCAATAGDRSSSRRGALLAAAAFAASTSTVAGLTTFIAPARAAEDGAVSAICDASCGEQLAAAEMITLPSGLQYKDVVVGTGPKVVTGYQVVVDYEALVASGKDKPLSVFESTVAKRAPVDIRVTGDKATANVIAGLDEGLCSMRVGGVRRLYIPGALAFPKGLASAPGRPRVPPLTDVVFDVKLLYIPGLEEDIEEE